MLAPNKTKIVCTISPGLRQRFVRCVQMMEQTEITLATMPRTMEEVEEHTATLPSHEKAA